MSDEKSLGDILTVAVAIPLGLWSLFWGLTMGILGGFVGIVPLLGGLGGVVAGLGFFVAAYGIFSDQPWAATVGIVAFGFDSVRRVYTLATDDVTFFAVSALFTLTSIAGLAYLASNREAYGSGASAEPYGGD